ncbi:MAG: LPD38 domain-containing protein, partial [Ghiorsea sp.]
GIARTVHEKARSKDAVFVRANGKQVWFEVDEPLVAEALAGLNYDGLNNGAMKAMRLFKRYLTIGVTASPEFKLRNLFRDTIQAIAVAKVKKNPFSNLAQGWKATDPDSRSYANMLMGGSVFGDSGYTHANDPDATRKMVKLGKGGSIVTDPKNFLKHIWKVYQDRGARFENVNRAANFEQALAEGKDLLTANFESRDHLDFSRTGSFTTVRAIAQVIPFLNARLQGLDKVARAGMDKSQRAQFLTVVGYYSVLSVAAYLLMADDDDYKEAEDWERDTYHLIKLSRFGLPAVNDADGNEVMFRLPRPFEVGAIANMAERMTEQITDDEAHGEDLAKAIKFTITQTLAIDLRPQMFKPALEVYANKNSFTGRSIESLGLQYKPVTERSKPWTSDTATVASKAMNTVLPDELTLSPVQIQHLTRGYFGWIGSTVLGSTDMLLTRQVLDTPERPDWRLEEYPVIKAFMEQTPKRHTKFAGEFYERMQELNKTFGQIKRYREDGNRSAAKETLDENRDGLKYRKLLNRESRKIGKLNKQAEKVYKSRTLTGKEKEYKLSQINKHKNNIYREAVKRSDSAFN